MTARPVFGSREPAPRPRPRPEIVGSRPDDESAAAAVEIDRLSRRFGQLTAVDGLSLAVPRGELFGLLGPNGAGKTTTIKMLTTLLPASGGSALVAGHDIAHDQRGVRRSIGYVPQLLSSDGALTARENLLTSARLYHLPRSIRGQRIQAALAFMGLEEAADRLVRTFSGGMIRRLEIAQAMLHEPAVLFLDEPTVGLDPIARRAVWEHVRRLREVRQTTILITTHYMDEATELCERVGIMHLGRLVALGRPAELAAQVGPEANLDDAFTFFTGTGLGNDAEGGSYRDVARTRRTARRLG